jgi:2-haloacid dehalogenase
VLQDSFERVCRKWGVKAAPDAGKRFADGVRSWGPHPDVVEPLKKMAEHYKLVILSNADDSFLAESVPKLGADFHAVLTAEQAGYYKPRYAAFEYMLEKLDASPEDFVHVASHTRYDHQSMHDMGFRNLVLLDRGYDPVTHGYDYVTVKSLDDLNTMLGI